MSQLSDTNRTRSADTSPRGGRTQSWLSGVFTVNQETLVRTTGLIQLGFWILNGLIALRFMLKLMAANPANPFAAFIYNITLPALWMFTGLTRTPSFEGIIIEFYDLIAIAVYAMLGWVVVRVLWLLFARMR